MLEKNAVGSAFRQHYGLMMTWLCDWAVLCGISVALQNSSQVDAMPTDAVNYLFFEGEEFGVGTGLKAAFEYLYLEFGRHGWNRLQRTCRALQGWRKLNPGSTHPPMPWLWLALMVLEMLTDGCVAEALGMLLMFWLYLVLVKF